ncbi:peptidyl-prolyl cis-trans isomerase FKBP8 isoform X2 [Neocloeon triangulifer]|uniref:peptidyl-prolyl cis-trans isomerase FKBP8 isoform X2 n=1 Tax=Neocloeon triangulifer TaxID=2078957 RepID=UPI00286F2317|nr:peptidyl-prolyl cis-trans isomerase FKBP8 isoform X2 [Neocloeon triangulifer]
MSDGQEDSFEVIEKNEVENQEEEGATLLEEKESTKDPEPEDEWVDILGSGQLRKKVLKPGEPGTRPQRGDICYLNIEGKLINGTVFEKLENFEIQVGDAELVQGLDLAVPLMDVGETALVEVHPRFGYGTLGKEPDVPEAAVLMYTVELVKADPEPEFEELSALKRQEAGIKKRERGNWWYSRNEHTLAVQCYRRALDFLDSDGGITAGVEPRDSVEDLKPIFAERLKVYNNLAASQMKLQAYDSALHSVENVLRCEPNNIKAMFRKGKILCEKGEYEKSVEVFKQANQLQPDNKPIQQELARVMAKSKHELSKQKNMYRKMLGQKDDKKSSSESSGKAPAVLS